MTDDPFTLPNELTPAVAPVEKMDKSNVISLRVDTSKNKKNVLTHKQARFVECVTKERMTASDAYRDAYDAENMKPASIHQTASQLMAHVEISLRIRLYWQAQERGRLSAAASKGEEIIRQLEAIAYDPKVSAASRIRALELLGKQRDVGIFVDRSIDESAVDQRTPDQVKQELEQQLQRLLGQNTA